MKHKAIHIKCFFIILYGLTIASGCTKEYSYEGGPVPGAILLPDSTTNPGSTQNTPLTFPYCSTCNTINTPVTFKWSFTIGSSLLCGYVTKGVLSPDGGGMTFFGPSTCTPETGLIITAFFTTDVLNKDQSNLTANRASLQYYDNIGKSDILQSKRPNIFSLKIDNYIKQTGVATGTFNGSVVDKNGNIVNVDTGKFYVKF